MANDAPRVYSGRLIEKMRGRDMDWGLLESTDAPAWVLTDAKGGCLPWFARKHT